MCFERLSESCLRLKSFYFNSTMDSTTVPPYEYVKIKLPCYDYAGHEFTYEVTSNFARWINDPCEDCPVQGLGFHIMFLGIPFIEIKPSLPDYLTFEEFDANIAIYDEDVWMVDAAPLEWTLTRPSLMMRSPPCLRSRRQR